MKSPSDEDLDGLFLEVFYCPEEQREKPFWRQFARAVLEKWGPTQTEE